MEKYLIALVLFLLIPTGFSQEGHLDLSSNYSNYPSIDKDLSLREIPHHLKIGDIYRYTININPPRQKEQDYLLKMSVPTLELFPEEKTWILGSKNDFRTPIRGKLIPVKSSAQKLDIILELYLINTSSPSTSTFVLVDSYTKQLFIVEKDSPATTGLVILLGIIIFFFYRVLSLKK